MAIPRPQPTHMTRQATGARPKARILKVKADFADGGDNKMKGTAGPRVHMQLKGAGGVAVPVVALLDTGADVPLMSRDLARQLKEQGVQLRWDTKTLGTAAGNVEVSEWVSCELQVQGPGGREMVLPVEAGVLDAGEEMLVGYAQLRDAGLLGLLEPGNSKNVSSADVSTRLGGEEDGAEVGVPDASGEGELVVDGAVRRLTDEVLLDFADLFDNLSSDSPARVPPLAIDLTPGMVPRRQAPRRMSPAVECQVDAEVKELLQVGVVKPSTSAFASPIVMIRKPDGLRRMCVGFRSLNAATEDMKFPIPHPRALLERLSGQSLFATLDLRSGFYQIPLCEDARRLTAFATPRGFTRVPFGLKNAPVFFQRTMVSVLAGLVGSICEVFIDDIVVFGRDTASFEANIRAVFDRLREFRLKLKAAKCHFGLKEITYLGHVVSRAGYFFVWRAEAGDRSGATTFEYRSSTFLRRVGQLLQRFHSGVCNLGAAIDRSMFTESTLHVGRCGARVIQCIEASNSTRPNVVPFGLQEGRCASY